MKNTQRKGLAGSRWIPGNRVSLLENAAAFFPRVFEAVRRAQREVIVETFILLEDKVGMELRSCLREATGRGVEVDLLIDGFGSPNLSDAFIQGRVSAGVRVRMFDPGHDLLGQQLNLLRRMHRRVAVIDDARAFVGGINFCADQLLDFGPTAKQDYAAELSGPIVQVIRLFSTYRLQGGWSGLTVGGGVNWQNRTCYPVAFSGGTLDYPQKAFALVSLMARYEISPKASVQFNLNKLFDKKYLDNISGQGYFGTPRRAMVTLSYKFEGGRTVRGNRALRYIRPLLGWRNTGE